MDSTADAQVEAPPQDPVQFLKMHGVLARKACDPVRPPASRHARQLDGELARGASVAAQAGRGLFHEPSGDAAGVLRIWFFGARAFEFPQPCRRVAMIGMSSPRCARANRSPSTMRLISRAHIGSSRCSSGMLPTPAAWSLRRTPFAMPGSLSRGISEMRSGMFLWESRNRPSGFSKFSANFSRGDSWAQLYTASDQGSCHGEDSFLDLTRLHDCPADDRAAGKEHERERYRFDFDAPAFASRESAKTIAMAIADSAAPKPRCDKFFMRFKMAEERAGSAPGSADHREAAAVGGDAFFASLASVNRMRA